MSDDRLCSCGACVEICGKTAYAPGGEPLVWKPDVCPDCLDDVGEPGSRAALEAELTRLREELAKHKPEERAGKCGCGDWEWNSDDGGFWCFEVDPMWGAESFGGAPRRCSSCDWELCTDGVARRNADTARVDALVRASRGCVGWRLHYHPGHPPADWVLHTIMPDGMYTGETLRGALDTIRVALDPEVGDGE
jgi:hypothetical protein